MRPALPPEGAAFIPAFTLNIRTAERAYCVPGCVPGCGGEQVTAPLLVELLLLGRGSVAGETRHHGRGRNVLL